MGAVAEQLRSYIGEPLVQYDALKPADEIAHPENIPIATLQTWLSFAQAVCETKDFRALAFTQLSEHVLAELGINESLPPRVMYLTESYKDERGYLLINPSILVPQNNIFVPVLEGCGSIGYTLPKYIIRRPTKLTISGYKWDGGTRGYTIFDPLNPLFNAAIHERDHLDGKTALDRSEDFLDVRNPVDLNAIQRYYGQYAAAYMDTTPTGTIQNYLHAVGPHGYITREKNRFIIVSAYGKTLGEFH